MVEYHDHDSLSSSQIAAFVCDPLLWYYTYSARTWPRPEPSPEMAFGTAVHRMIEIGDRNAVVKRIPPDALNVDGHCKGKAWLEWKQANPADIYLKPGEQDPLSLIGNHLQANSWCREVIERSRKEVEHYWQDDDFGPCRAKFDAVTNGMLVDWKTTSRPDARTFAAEINARAYDLRMAFYRRGYRDKYGSEPEVYFVAICTTGGYSVTPYRLPNDWLDDAEARLIIAVDDMRRFSLGRYLDACPQVLDQPKWSKFQLENAA